MSRRRWAALPISLLAASNVVTVSIYTTYTMGEDKYVYPPAEALVLVKGLAELRRDARVYLDLYVWQQVERGEWLLTKPEVRSFDWKNYEPQAFHRRVMALMENPPPQKPPNLIFRTHDSETRETIIKCYCFARFDGQQGGRRIDMQGFGTLPISSKTGQISVQLGNPY